MVSKCAQGQLFRHRGTIRRATVFQESIVVRLRRAHERLLKAPFSSGMFDGGLTLSRDGARRGFQNEWPQSRP
jgi:hypothetical protein